MEKIIGLKELRENLPYYAEKIERGQSFLVVKKSKPVFRICPFDEDNSLWEEVVDFTKIKRGGVSIDELLARL
jgi:antitoxin (DNA-binding transcriptional repressor) of toxin-antitoxin stability system